MSTSPSALTCAIGVIERCDVVSHVSTTVLSVERPFMSQATTTSLDRQQRVTAFASNLRWMNV